MPTVNIFKSNPHVKPIAVLYSIFSFVLIEFELGMKIILRECIKKRPNLDYTTSCEVKQLQN